MAQAETASTENILCEEHLGQILHLAGQMYFAQADIARGINAQIDGIISTRSLSEGMTGYRLQTMSVGESVAAISILTKAREQGLEILELHRDNIDKETDRLEGSPELIKDIRAAVAAGNLVIIPEKDIRMGEWQGTGYMVIDPESGAGSYMIHGGIVGKAGGGSGSINPIVTGNLCWYRYPGDYRVLCVSGYL